MSSLQIKTAKIFEPLLGPARYKGAWGGRGSGKSHFFADTLIDDALRFPGEAGEGLRGLCVREIQKSLKQSAKRLIEQKLIEFNLGERDGFKVYESVIKTPGDGVLEFQGMQDHTAESVKSFEGFQRAWLEEGQTISKSSINLLRPTIRWEDTTRGLESEIWVSWNPRKKTDPVDLMLRGQQLPSNSVVINANWQDNPWFPRVLEQERLDCLRSEPGQYDNIWDGGYSTVLEGAYYADSIQTAKAENRVGVVGPDQLMTIRLYADIGGTGARADAFTFWAVQFIGLEIRVLNYYEEVGQPIGTHLSWLRSQKYLPGDAQIWLPHDGDTNDRVYDVSYAKAFKNAGYGVTVIPNQGKGAAKARIESGRRAFSNCNFNESTTEDGLSALGWYHEKRDENRGIGLGPEHDWSSHGADSFGLMAIDYEQYLTQSRKPKFNMPSRANSQYNPHRRHG